MNNATNTNIFPYLERLLEGEAVEWKTLGEVCKIKNGKDYKHLSNGSVPVYGSGGVMKYVNEAIYSQPSVLIPRKGSLNNLFFVDTPFWNVDTIYYTEINTDYILPKFFYYYLVTLELEKLNLAGGVPSLTQSTLNKLSIPIPPLRVQARIVEILDKFTQLEAELEKELEAELEARKKQYAYYRDQLLNFSQCPPLNVNIEWKTLGEVCENICSGGTPSTKKKQYYQGTIPWLRTQDIDWREVYDTEIKITEEAIANSSAKLIPTNCVIVAMYGATAAKACINKIPLTTNQACCNLQVNEKVAHYKYVYYWISNEYERLKAQGEGSQSNLNARKIKSYKIPLPPLSEQRRIVDILDRFDTLTNSISEGLPKEIALRRKQYEYYSDALLNFPRAEVTA